MVITKKLTDLKFLHWDKTRESSGTAGSYLKSFSYSNGRKVYYKLSYYDDINGVFGYESFNEIIACKLMELLNINHLDYNLMYSSILINGNEYNTYLNYSYDFKKENEDKITFENFYYINKYDNENIIDFCKRYNFIDDIYNIFIVDYLIINRDRHGANIEVLFNRKTKEYRIAPLFDQGLSFLSPNYLDDDIKAFQINIERKVNSFIGSTSLTNNLNLVPKEYLPKYNLDINYIFEDLNDILNEDYLNKCKEILKERWDYIVNLQNKK